MPGVLLVKDKLLQNGKVLDMKNGSTGRERMVAETPEQETRLQ